MRNHNQKVIRRLSRQSLKNNRLRNLFAILAIALTCMLFTVTFSFGIGMARITQEQTMREVGGKFHAGIKRATFQQMEEIVKDPRVVSYSYNILIGFAENILQRQTEIRIPGDENEAANSFIHLEEGALPQARDEVVVDTLVLDALGLPYRIGENVPLTFTFHGKTIHHSFTLSGWYQGDQISHASQCYLSKEYWAELKGSLTDEDFLSWGKTHPNDAGQGLYSVNLFFKNASHIEDTVTSIIQDAGYEPEKELNYGVNWAYMESRLASVDPFNLIILLFALLVILLAGYLIIYNIFQISVMNDIRFYGLLKTIGASRRQLKHLIFRQAMILSGIGIPLGLLFGFLSAVILFPFAMSIYENGGIAVRLHLSPATALFSVLFSLITVLCSCRKPGKVAGSVSPMEAVRYTEGNGTRKKEKRSETGAKISHMALSNLGRNKKKTLFVILSLSLSVSILCVILTGVGSFRLDNFLNSRLIGDVVVGNVSYTGNGSLTNDFAIDPEYLSLLDQQPGILSRNEMYSSIYTPQVTLSEEDLARYRELRAQGQLREQQPYMTSSIEKYLSQKELPAASYGYDPELLSHLQVIEGELDIEKFLQGGYILLTPILGNRDPSALLYEPGDQITLQTVSNPSNFREIKDSQGNTIDLEFLDKEETEYEVMAIVDFPSSMTKHMSLINTIQAILPKDFFTRNDFSGELFAVSYTLEEQALKNFLTQTEAYTEHTNRYMGYLSRESLIQEFSGMTNTLQLIGISLCAVIALIGVLNFINSIFTGILSRKREFAILLSIGMTQKQLKQMLLTEGLYYVLITALVSIPVGSILSYTILTALNQVILFFEYRYNFFAFLIMLPLFTLIALLAPSLAYSRAARTSIVERLRDTEN